MDLLKLQPLKVVGEYIEQSGPSGAALVNTVKTGIEIVQNTKLQLKDIVKDSGQAAIDAAAARVKEGLNQSSNSVLGEKVQQAAIPILIGVVLLFLIMRRK